MPTTIVVGGQYGSEGKGKVVATLAKRAAEPWVVRCGGPNSGHTINWKGEQLVLRQVPSGVVNDASILLVGAGAVLDEEILLAELDLLGIPRNRIVVDPMACLTSPTDRAAEEDLYELIASTGSGTGAALVRRMQRRAPWHLAENSSLDSRVRVEKVAPLLHEAQQRKATIIVEGTQGFGLSLLHGLRYPFVTARDTTASAFASEVGLSPRMIDHVTMVLRTFPIRVGGNSGPLDREISWSEVQRLGGAPRELPELTSVTKRVRRVAHFDMGEVVRAVNYNAPTELALMGADRLNHDDSGIRSWSQLSDVSQGFVRSLEETTGTPVRFVGTGFDMDDVICEVPRVDRR